MEKRGVSSAMDGSVEAWDWEVLPEEHRSFYAETRPAAAPHAGDGGEAIPLAGDQETEEEPVVFPPMEDGDRHHASECCKDIGVVPSPEPVLPTVLPVSDDGEEYKLQISGGNKEVDDGTPEEEDEFTGDEEEEEEIIITKKADSRTRPAAPCVVFSVGNLKVNGIGALCSFGVAAAATLCVFLVGGKLQHHHKLHHHHQQFLGGDDDKRMQQVVQQTSSRLNQAMSSVMGAAAGGGSARADITFGGFYDAF